MNFRYYLLKLASTISNNGIFKAYQEALSWDALSPSQVKTKQENLLSQLLTHAYHRVPYYQNILSQSGIYAGKGEPDLTKFNQIPFLTKDILRDQSENLLSSDWKKRGGKPNSSSGSTGEPARFIQDQAYRSWCVYANKLYYHHVLGKFPGEREMLLWGSERDILRGSIGIKAKLINVFYNRELLNAYRLNRETMADYIHRINTYKPVAIWAYVESLAKLAEFAEKEGLTIHPPKFIVSTAGTLYPEIREPIERVFKAPLYNQYGSTEVGGMACQCLEQDKLHLFPWSHVVEVVDTNGKATPPGQEGEVVVTNLRNYAQPFIRYKLGDLAILPQEPCSCGRSHLIIEHITGRKSEHLLALDGTYIYGGYFRKLFFYRTWIKKYQVVQAKPNEVINKIVVKGTPIQRELDEIESLEKKALGQNMNIRFEVVDEILPSASGKYLFIINLVEHPHNNHQ